MSATGIFGKKRKPQPEFYLQITSLIDTLVIILVFMLMTLGSESIEMEVAQGLTLPWASQGAELTRSLKLAVKTDGVYLDQEKIAPLENGVSPAGTTSEDGRKIQVLFERLLKTAVDSKKAAEKSDVKFDGKILLQADKTIPLKTIKQILYTSARAGYNDFKFAVVRQ